MPLRVSGGAARAGQRGCLPPSPAHSQTPISFAEISLYFSPEEWALLNPHQWHLYESVMLDNYEDVIFVGNRQDHEPIDREPIGVSPETAMPGLEQVKRSFQCKDCEKSFSRTSYLPVHQKTHTGKKHYHCLERGENFSQSSWLPQHQRTHTVETIEMIGQWKQLQSEHKLPFQMHLRLVVP